MISHGDEIGRSQRGNNNAYCQDNELAWMNWDLDDDQLEMLKFTRKVFGILHNNPVLRRRSFFRGRPINPSGVKDVAWLKPDGSEMTEPDWHQPKAQTLGMLLPGAATDERDDRGRPIAGETLLLLLNAGERTRHFALPKLAERGTWHEAINTARTGTRVARGETLSVAPQSLILLHYRKTP